MGLWLVAMAALTGCHRYQVIPDHLKQQVNPFVTYPDIRRDPSRAVGQTVVLGGEVLHATRYPDRTRIEILQMPLSQDCVPAGNRSSSQGRFMAFDQKGEIVDPAILQEGTRVTIIGEVQAPVSEQLDESEYVYPTVAIRDMTIWDLRAGVAPGGPLIGPYWGGYPYGVRPYTFWSGTRVAG